MIYFTVIITIAILDYELIMDAKYKNKCINLKNISVNETDLGHQAQVKMSCCPTHTNVYYIAL